MRKKRIASGYCVFASSCCRMKGVSFFTLIAAARGRSEEAARDGRGADLDEGEALDAAVDHVELAGRRHERDADGLHERRRVGREPDVERLERPLGRELGRPDARAPE